MLARRPTAATNPIRMYSKLLSPHDFNDHRARLRVAMCWGAQRI